MIWFDNVFIMLHAAFKNTFLVYIFDDIMQKLESR